MTSGDGPSGAPDRVRVVRVLPDVAAIDRQFDYVVPDALSDQVRVGTRVRVSLHGRRVGAWVVVDHVEAPPGLTLRPLSAVSGWGPPPGVIDLARWAAWRWAGPPSRFLATASPPTSVRSLPRPAGRATRPESRPFEDTTGEAFAGGAAVARVPPAADGFAFVEAATRYLARGDVLVLTPGPGPSADVARRLVAMGVAVARYPGDWAAAAAGGSVVVGARSAAWAPVRRLAAAVVLDAHDESYKEQRAPTWDARAVVAEMARRDGSPCVMVSPCPGLELLHGSRLVVPSRRDEREGWPILQVIDRRGEDPRTGMFSPRLVPLLRGASPGQRVLCVLNRRGRARLLACRACGALARCEVCGGAVAQAASVPVLECGRCGEQRPALCALCGAQSLRIVRAGVSRVKEELEALAEQPVEEITGAVPSRRQPTPEAAVLVGTEAVLHRVDRAGAVVFLDFDQELLAPHYRAAEAALALLCRAGRLVGGRATPSRPTMQEGNRSQLVVVQTRLAHHPVIDAALHADPGRLARSEAPVRAALRLPPDVALASVSGPAAEAYVSSLKEELARPGGPGPGPGVEISRRGDDRWLVRASDHRVLCDTLAQVRRPPGRIRVEVDPDRI